MTLTHVDLFSGIGGFALAAHWAGFEVVCFCEIEPYARRVLSKHWPQVPCYEDIRHFPIDAYRGCTLITGGFPCQPFSCAGKQTGTDDPRYLWPAMFGVIRGSRPAWVVAENNPPIVRMALHLILADLASEGYEARVFGIPAAGVGLPHLRERVWIVAHANQGGRRDRADSLPAREPVSRFSGRGVAHSRREHGEWRPPIQTGDCHRYRQGPADGAEAERSAGCGCTELGVGVADANCERREEQRGAFADGTQQRTAECRSGGVAHANPTGGRLRCGEPSDRDGQPRRAGEKDGDAVGVTMQGRRSRDGRRRSAEVASQGYEDCNRDSRATQPVVGGVLDGLPTRMDCGRPVAPRGAEQEEWEPPRTAKGIRDRRKRLEAIGNAIVPQVAYPILQFIADYERGVVE